MIRSISLACLSTTLVACTSVPNEPNWLDLDAARKGEPNLVVCRQGDWTYEEELSDVYLNGQKVASLGNDEEVYIRIPEGDVELRTKWHGKARRLGSGRPLNIKSNVGLVYTYHAAFGGPGSMYQPHKRVDSKVTSFTVGDVPETVCLKSVELFKD